MKETQQLSSTSGVITLFTMNKMYLIGIVSETRWTVVLKTVRLFSDLLLALPGEHRWFELSTTTLLTQLKSTMDTSFPIKLTIGARDTLFNTEQSTISMWDTRLIVLISRERHFMNLRFRFKSLSSILQDHMGLSSNHLFVISLRTSSVTPSSLTAKAFELLMQIESPNSAWWTKFSVNTLMKRQNLLCNVQTTLCSVHCADWTIQRSKWLRSLRWRCCSSWNSTSTREESSNLNTSKCFEATSWAASYAISATCSSLLSMSWSI